MKWSGKTIDSESSYKNAMAGLGSTATVQPVAVVETKKEEVKTSPKPEKKSIVPKEPVKILRYKTWEISN